MKKQSCRFKRLSSLPVLITFTFQVSESGSVRLQLRKIAQVLKVYTINELPHPWKIGNTVVSAQENEDESQKIFCLKMNSRALKCRISGSCTQTRFVPLFCVWNSIPLKGPFQGSQSHLNWESTGLIACMCGNGTLKLFLVVFIVIERLH